MERIAEDGQITGQDIDWTQGDEEKEDHEDNLEPDEEDEEAEA